MSNKKSNFKFALKFLFTLLLIAIIYDSKSFAIFLIPVMWVVSEFHIRQNEKVKNELDELKNKVIEIEKSLSKNDNVNLWSGVGKKNNN